MTTQRPAAAAIGGSVQRYRLMSFHRPLGPWRATKADAKADAIAAGVGAWDDDLGVVFLTVPAWIAEELGEPVPPRPPSELTERVDAFRRRRPPPLKWREGGNQPRAGRASR